MRILCNSKAIQENNISAKVIKESDDFFAEVICNYFND